MLFLFYAMALAADWLHAGDVQKREKILNVNNVKDLKLLWKIKLDGRPTAPVIFGHLITYRGTRELVIVATNSNSVFAVDADLGKLFWKRHLETSEVKCGNGLTAAPAITPAPAGTEDLDDDDAPQTLRPIYVIASDGKLHSLSPSTGDDLKPPAPFVPPGADASWLKIEDGNATVETSGECGVKAGKWSMKLAETAEKPHVEGEFRGGKYAKPAETATNGVLYAMKGKTLLASNAATGEVLFTSGNQITAPIGSSGLAIANGHVCFGAQDGTLYCFGFPVDR